MDYGEVSAKLTGWIKERVTDGGCRGVVLGLSGGIDSAVLAILCHQAFPETTLALIMPCYSLPLDEEHAQLVADKFHIVTQKVILDDVFDNLVHDLPNYTPEERLIRLARGNLKARLRMITLYYAANQLQYMVAGSSNRSELAMGYFTKFGDSGVDILPLGNLLKTQVRELAQYLEVPDVIINKPPSAGLWEGQTDEAEMGFTYEALDRYLETGEASPDIKKAIEARYNASRHKCAMPPIAPIPGLPGN